MVGSSSNSRITLFLFFMIIFATHASAAVAMENPAEEPSAIAYRGSSDFGQRYGVLFPPLAHQTARFKAPLENDRRLTRRTTHSSPSSQSQ